MGAAPIQQYFINEPESWSWLKWVAGVAGAIIAGVTIELFRRKRAKRK